jgi:GNAT superfamily N-acetyltransferase
MKVRPARAKDAERCAEISGLRSAKELRDLVGQADTQWLALEDDAGRVVGVGIIHLWAWNQVAWVWDLTTDQGERGKGYGRTLLKGMIRAARQMGARVLMDFGTHTPSACSLVDLYVRNGFRVCGTNDRWFANQRDATAVFYGYDLR